MNSQFLIWFLVLCVLLFAADTRFWPRLSKGMRITYILFFTATLVLYLGVMLHINIPMPTQYFISVLSPRVTSMIAPP